MEAVLDEPTTTPATPLQIHRRDATAPQLHSGDRMRQPEFHRIYAELPDVQAELVGGRVFVASPVSELHATEDSVMSTWVGTYAARVPQLKSVNNCTFIASLDDEVQPDCALIVREGGLSRTNEKHIREGVGELFVEVSYSSASYDLYEKFEAYRREGVREYVVAEIKEARVRWFVLRDGDYAELEPEDGVLKSTQFPGLWLKAEAAANEDAASVLDTLAAGMATPEFAAFVAGP